MMVPRSDILGANILIVDDQAANVELLEQLLREEGYTGVTSTMDPTTVAALHKKHRYDLILLDLQIPVMDGFEVMAALKAADPDGYVPILVVTAQPGHKLRALQEGAKDFVGKPFDVVEVKTRIHNMLEVRLLYKKLADYNAVLEKKVEERTAELSESEARYRSLTELASDWYWEQDEHGKFSRVSGPVREMLGIWDPAEGPAGSAGALGGGWNEAERKQIRATIAARQPFVDFVFSRTHADGSTQNFRVSGEPMFSRSCRFVGYRGIGVEFAQNHAAHSPARPDGHAA